MNSDKPTLPGKGLHATMTCDDLMEFKLYVISLHCCTSAFILPRSGVIRSDSGIYVPQSLSVATAFTKTLMLLLSVGIVLQVNTIGSSHYQ